MDLAKARLAVECSCPTRLRLQPLEQRKWSGRRCTPVAVWTAAGFVVVWMAAGFAVVLAVSLAAPMSVESRV
eukprot:848531-Prymnesium_polylepis.1